MSRALSVWLALLLCACGNRYELAATWNELRGDPYELDSISRELEAGAMPGCPGQVPTVTYGGEVVPYQVPVRVAQPFAAKLRRFEQIVAEVSVAHYGRRPDRLLHFGARACRSVRGGSRRLSEHALGNAIDVSGFEFSRVRRSKAGQAAAFAKSFTVSVQRHWEGRAGEPESAVHRDFLHALVARVVDERVFRGVIGPGREGHSNHLHFDQSPWQYVLF